MKRDFYIGEEWLFYKIYCGKNTANDILVHIFDNVVQVLIEKKKIDKWFFIRYQDPDFHIRLRFHLTDITYLNDIIGLLKNKLYCYLCDGIIWKLQIEGYSREIERYGESTIEMVESIFSNDSTLIINAIKEIKNEKDYLLFMIKSIDATLGSFGLNNNEKLRVCKNSFEQFKDEFKLTTKQLKILNARYRDIQDEMNGIISKKVFKDKNGFIKKMEEKVLKDKTLINEIKSQRPSNLLESNILLGIVHMSTNRAFKDNQRFIEMVVYDFLCKYYSYIEYAKQYISLK